MIINYIHAHNGKGKALLKFIFWHIIKI